MCLIRWCSCLVCLIDWLIVCYACYVLHLLAYMRYCLFVDSFFVHVCVASFSEASPDSEARRASATRTCATSHKSTVHLSAARWMAALAEVGLCGGCWMFFCQLEKRPAPAKAQRTPGRTSPKVLSDRDPSPKGGIRRGGSDHKITQSPFSHFLSHSETCALLDPPVRVPFWGTAIRSRRTYTACLTRNSGSGGGRRFAIRRPLGRLPPVGSSGMWCLRMWGLKIIVDWPSKTKVMGTSHLNLIWVRGLRLASWNPTSWNFTSLNTQTRPSAAADVEHVDVVPVVAAQAVPSRRDS